MVKRQLQHQPPRLLIEEGDFSGFFALSTSQTSTYVT